MRQTSRIHRIRQTLAEALGTGFLVMIVVGSGIMAERLSDGHQAVALLANTLATGAGLVVLITLLGPISGAHFNPVVSAFMALRGELKLGLCLGYMIAQCLGGIGGTLLAHAMFDLPLIQMGTHIRQGQGLWISEAVATFGLLLTIMASVRFKPEATALMVGLYITSAYWFTASTAFANPAVTLARSFTQSFAGIAPESVMGFIAAQIFGAFLALMVVPWFLKEVD